MRHVQILVPDEHLDAVTSMLDEEEFDYLRQRTWYEDEEAWLVTVPVPTDAIGYVLDQLAETGIDSDRYTTVTSLESAMTPGTEALQERFADDFDPLTRPELRSKARAIARDWRSFLAMVLFSVVIAVAGLLIESTAVVVGSMVIAPLVGPVMTATVGAVTQDREMLLRSVWLQAAGLGVAVAGAFAFSLGLQWLGYFPATLDVAAMDLITLRLAPTFVTLAIGLAAGAAGAYGLMTKGPTSLIGVMIAAALVPAAATVGIAAAWAQYRIAVGAALLLVLSLVLINVGAFVTLRWYYHPRHEEWLSTPAGSGARRALLATAIAVAVVFVVVGAASFSQIAFERTVNEEIADVIGDQENAELALIGTRIEYAGAALGSPATVTVLVRHPADGERPDGLAEAIDRRITSATDREIHVAVRFREYQLSDERAQTRAMTRGGHSARLPASATL